MRVFLFSPLLTINFGIFACTQSTHLIRCFWCTWSMFLNKCFYLGFFYGKSFCFFVFISFCICILLAFSSASLLASFSLYCFSVLVALFLSSLGLSPQIILSISISSSSGTFCLCILTFVLGFVYSLRAEHLLVVALSFTSCLCFCPHILYAIIFVPAKSK